jgi:hypothetical protein
LEQQSLNRYRQLVLCFLLRCDLLLKLFLVLLAQQLLLVLLELDLFRFAFYSYPLFPFILP